MPSSKPRTLSDSSSDGPSFYPFYSLEHDDDTLYSTWVLHEMIVSVAHWHQHFPVGLFIVVYVGEDHSIKLTGDEFLQRLRLDLP